MEKITRDDEGMIVHIYIIALEKKLLVIRFFKALDFKAIIYFLKVLDLKIFWKMKLANFKLLTIADIINAPLL